MPLLKRWNATAGAWETVGQPIGSAPASIQPNDNVTWTGRHHFTAPGGILGETAAVSVDQIVTSTPAAANDYAPFRLNADYLATDASSTFDLTYMGGYSSINYGNAATPAKGTVHTWTAILLVNNSSSSQNEFCNSMHVMRFDNGETGRAWGTDWNMHGPIAAQPGLLNGITQFINNYYNGTPSGGPSGNWLVTRPAGGGGASSAHMAATTYKLDVGLGITGYAGTSGAKTRGFEVGIQVGGYGSGWMLSSESSKIGKGVRILDTEDAAIQIEVTGAPGAIRWGAAGAASDTNLYRRAADNLATDDDLEVATAGKGLILRDGSGNRFRLTISGGAVAVAAL